jgi:hypothetical protein
VSGFLLMAQWWHLTLICCLLYVRLSSKCFTIIKTLTKQLPVGTRSSPLYRWENRGQVKHAKIETQMRKPRHQPSKSDSEALVLPSLPSFLQIEHRALHC